ncbi:MAG: hypothetical protein CMP59_04970 [Flavobacteriales bacterium]|nr:hypothetical protein [Flavobacteriales bacterium]|tara:strand:- start:688 stop:2571 length:1884 start_codon:yes stop_codon:yes gene_type:complete
MKLLRSYWLLVGILMAHFGLAQDTIRIKEVEVEAKRELLELGSQRIDSIGLADPTNKDLGASLQKYSHAFVKSYGIGSMASVSLRGSGSSHTNLLWNGVQLNSNSHGTADLSLYPPFFTENLAVFYGQNSSQFGSGGLGGAVSMANQVSFNAKDQIEFQQKLGSFGYSSTAAKASFGNNKFRSISRLIYSRADNDFSYRDMSEIGFPEHSLQHADFEQKGLLQSIHYRLRADRRIDVHLWYMNTYRELPGMMAIRDLEEIQEDENLRAQVIFNQYFKGGKLVWNSSFVNDQLLYDNREQANSSASENLSLRNYLEGDYAFKDWNFKARMDLDWDRSIQSSLNGGEVERFRKAVYTNINKDFGRKWNLSLAARNEWIEDDYFFLPELKAAFEFSKNGEVWFIAGRNMKYPSLNDLYWASGGNSDLKAEESQNLELGHSLEIAISKRTSLELKNSVYYALIANFIQWVPSSNGYWSAENLKEVQSTGLESSIGFTYKGEKLSQRLTLNYNYNRSINLQKNHIADASVGKQLIYQPEHQYNLNSRTAVKQYYFDANLQFISARYIQSDNEDYLPYFSLVDFTLGRIIKMGADQLQLSFSVRNLLDEEYQAIQWRPMPGRNYMVTLNYKLK